MRRSTGRLSLPAGAIEPGETPEAALEREVHEKTGLVVRAGQLLGAFGGSAFRTAYPSGDEVEFVTLLYRAQMLSGALAPNSEGAPEFVTLGPHLDWETAFPIELRQR